MLRALVAACLLCLAVPAAASAVPPGLSGDEPISVAGRTIPLEEITRWARVSARGEGRGAGRGDFEAAAHLLITNRWLEGEAKLRGIEVSSRTVRRAFRRHKRASFPDDRDYRRWLRRSGQTDADIRYRMRLDLLSNRIRDEVIGGAKRSHEQQRRLDEFVAEFVGRWRAQTLCTPRFSRALEDCGNYQTVSNSSS